ncbi:hypothetical protein IVB45_02250 [Bradyrhizobium sp. 4]|uniref:hypothetical protein n=1 Tax=Bradyrhizobium sp. 4 TaxID=2782678 RepID=UPI001FFE46F8|nr:hypothetical protein [Bradyrhizobium sp. 4]UPJ35856.1 hypothetical protein IVB45_02250 [Bradyrhizobium sp. 4]
MSTDIDKLREIFLTEVDEDIRADNEEKIKEWQTALVHNEALASWKEHDITKQIIARARDSYKQTAMMLWKRRSMTEVQRQSAWAEQDAMLWLIQLAADDPKREIEKINMEITAAINATSA